eukprot:GAHX01001006.1.p1 GENE.GAHX01001006.1~~GAHX01001006.1.p1  ORF type:complete len:781 (-),score=178.63 GAHX01001006.1:38-2380(-)
MDNSSLSKNLFFPHYELLKEALLEYIRTKEVAIPESFQIERALQFSFTNKNFDFSILSFPLEPFLSKAVSNITQEIADMLQKANGTQSSPLFEAIGNLNVSKKYVNIALNPSVFKNLLKSFQSSNLFSTSYYSDNFLSQQAKESLPKTMFEYSQPNTHKVFHVGHMRNAALGSALVNIHRALSYEVVAVNYFGDEGAHIFKCLWLLNKRVVKDNLDNLDNISGNMLEYLGDLYSTACRLLGLKSLTSLPYPEYVFKKIKQIESTKETKGLSSVKITIDLDGCEKIIETFIRNKYFDLVINNTQSSFFIAINEKLGDKGDAEYLNLHTYKNSKYKKTAFKKHIKLFKPNFVQKGIKIEVPTVSNTKTTNFISKERAKGEENKVLSDGVNLAEFGAFETVEVSCLDEDLNFSIKEIVTKRKEAVSLIGKEIEINKSKFHTDLWMTTRRWSLENFDEIYNWLNIKFDHLFTESEVSEPAKKIVMEKHEEGIFEKVNGAIGVKLKSGYAVLLKSNGTSLYLTKDLALAALKFNEYQIEKNVYVVDSAQTQHFQQVFEILELLGFKNAKNCLHLPYGQVVLESGKMSSRLNNSIAFTQLKKELEDEIKEKLNKGKFNEYDIKEKEDIIKKVSISTIKYGMLNVEKEKLITFNIKKWTNFQGNTGPYILYTYARIQSIKKQVEINCNKIDWDTVDIKGKEIEVLRKLCGFWSVVGVACFKYEPSLICKGLFEVCQMFSSWYSNKENSIKYETNKERQKFMLQFVEMIGEYVKSGLDILGIKTLDRM